MGRFAFPDIEEGGIALGWPAAKYLPYAFWRAWFLVMYSSPIWMYFALPDAANPGLQMHYVSTTCFIVISVLLAFFHIRAVGLLSSRVFMVLMGVVAGTGVVLEFGVLALWGSADNGLFWVGAALTGLATAPIAVRAGQIYASVRVGAAVTATLLSDVAAGLIFFFAVGTWPAIGLLLAAGLPLLSALTLAISSAGDDDSAAPEEPVDFTRAPVKPFSYFLVAAFLIGAVAFLQNSLGGSWFDQASIDSGSTLGVSLLIMACFVLTVAFACVQKIRLEALCRPTILMLSACVLFAYLIHFGSPVAMGGTLLVYCLFSSYIWVLMAYLGHGRYFSPIQVFGYGRAVYAGGSLIGGLVGVYLLPSLEATQGIPAIAVAMVCILLLCAVAIRPKDLASILVQDDGEDRVREEGRARVRIEEPASSSSAHGDTESPATPGDVHLSPREMEVYALMRDGRDAAYIADSLCVSRNTAKTHIRNIYGKFGVHTRQEFIDVMQGRAPGQP